MPRLLWACRRYIVFALVIFICGFVSGFYASSRPPGVRDGVFDQVIEGFREMGERVESFGLWGRVGFVFKNNARVVLLSILAGVLFGIPPIIVTFLNGLFIGVVSGDIARQGVHILTFLLVGVLPHGIFELPAFILAEALAIRLGFNILAYRRGSFQGKTLMKVARATILLTVLIVLPLLGLAALVEMTITRSLAKWVIGPAIL